MSTRRIYLEFDGLVHSAQSWLATQCIPDTGYRCSTVRERLGQRIVELGLVPFTRVSQTSHARNGETALQPESTDCGAVRIDASTGRTTLAPRHLPGLLLEFFAYWGLGLAAVAKSFFSKSALARIPTTLLFGVGKEGLFHRGSDARFVAYCRQGPVRPLSAASQLLVQSAARKGAVSDARVMYARWPLLALAQGYPPSGRERLTLLACHLLAPGRFLVLVLRYPLLALLAPDLALGTLARALHRQHAIEAIVVTNSAYTSQPLWMREFGEETDALHMVWYSQNTVPLVCARDPVAYDLPHTRHIRVSHHWVWTEGYKAYLERLVRGASLHVVGPILWYQPELKPRPDDALQIAVFDVTPLSDESARQLGLVDNYYSAAHMQAFVRGVASLKAAVERALTRPVRILLKHKRHYGAMHDRAYVELIASVSAPEDGFTLVPFDDNMYSMISSSALAVVVPYSSPAYVAAYLGVPAIFFDPTRLLAPTCDPAPLLDFASGEEALVTKALLAIENDLYAMGR